MRAYHRVHVELRKKERKQIARMLNKGWESARVLRRALILRQLDRGQTAGQVASQVGVASKPGPPHGGGCMSQELRQSRRWFRWPCRTRI